MEFLKETKMCRMNEIQQHPQNARIHTKKNLDAIKKSLSQWGQYKPIVVQKSSMYILAGNGTYQAAVALGWAEIECTLIDVTDEQAKAILIMDNRSSDLSQTDEKMVLDMLQDMDADLFDLTGYDEADLDKMLQFQEGALFDDEKKDKKPKKEKKQDAPSSADDQLSFILMGYPFNLADTEQIRAIRDLMNWFEEQNIEVKCETTFRIWNAIQSTLEDAMRGKPFVDDGIETDRA